MTLKGRIYQYKIDGRNLFSTTEAITAALIDSDLYQVLMPEPWKNDPMAAYFTLDSKQKALVTQAHQAANQTVTSTVGNAGGVK